jgi:hypothetical protein
MDQGSRPLNTEMLPLVEGDWPWAARYLVEQWSSTAIVTRGRVHDTAKLPGFIAWQDGQPLGLLTCRPTVDEREIISLNSLGMG